MSKCYLCNVKKSLFINIVSAVCLVLSMFGNSVARAAVHPHIDSLKMDIGRMLTRVAQREVRSCPVRVSSIAVKGGVVRITTSITMSYYPVREERLAALNDSVRELLPADWRAKKIEIIADGQPLQNFIPRYYRSSVKGVKPFMNGSKGGQLVRRERPYEVTAGLADRHIALWQSHGRFFDTSRNEWRWQRPLLWQTVEDLFTQSYVLPYLVPMLENAGATVMLPRERDFQTEEVIADNERSVDICSSYRDYSGEHLWRTFDEGFAHKQQTYLSGENPFAHGSCRIAKTAVGEERESVAEWSVAIPRTGDYAVYVAYRTFRDSASDATYTVRHAGGESRVQVNQLIGGGTWIYIGTFIFKEGEQPSIVSLSNRSASRGTVCADAVKIGGGRGNIARTVCDSLRVAGADYTPVTSGMARYCEGARYWLQWAGFDESVYNPQRNCNDYKDDYMSRGEWVNALMGGSDRLPKREGLGVPIDLALAFHSDAGITDDDRTIGTLGIYYTRFQKGKFEGGARRYISRDVTDMVMSQIAEDVRRTYEPEWTRRGMWNKSYYEARVPSVPTMLLELLSHQNLADMRLGHDPNFKFVVSRAIYKAILRHVSAQYGVPYCVTPLAVEAFRTHINHDGDVTLAWSPVVDSLESSAAPKHYMLYTRVGDGGFDDGRQVCDTIVTVKQQRGVVYSYRVAAVNDGGESFPSETLSVCVASSKSAKQVLVVNGFDRVSAPECREDGFHNEFDSGVAYLRDVAFVGEQRVHDVTKRREKSELRAFGVSNSDYEGEIVGGNIFDYPYQHGCSIAAAGYSFASASVLAVEREMVDVSDVAAVDLILGKQRATSIGRGVAPAKYRCFTPALQQWLTDYLDGGGALFVSGCYVATDLFASSCATVSDAEFAKKVLHVELVDNMATRSYEASSCSRSVSRLAESRTYSICAGYCPDMYPVNSVDGLAPVGEACTLMRYTDSRLAAAVGCRDKGATLVLGFPFEAIAEREARDVLMRDALKYLLD